MNSPQPAGKAQKRCNSFMNAQGPGWVRECLLMKTEMGKRNKTNMLVWVKGASRESAGLAKIVLDRFGSAPHEKSNSTSSLVLFDALLSYILFRLALTSGNHSNQLIWTRNRIRWFLVQYRLHHALILSYIWPGAAVRPFGIVISVATYLLEDVLYF